MFVKTLISGLCLAAMLSAAADTRLADAAMQGDRTAVAALLKQKADVNAQMGDGTSALHWAAFKNDADMVKLLLQAGANVKATTRLEAITPLYMAASNGNPAIVEALLKAGANANEANANGTTVLMQAAASGSVDTVKLLLDKGADVNSKEKTNGQTALMFAAALNRGPVIRTLLANGADAKATSKVVQFTKILVDANGDPLPGGNFVANPDDARTATVKASANGANAGARTPPATPRGGFADRVFGALVQGGMTPLHFAAREGQMDAVQALIEGGADVNQGSAADNTSPLIEALINGHFDIAKYMLDKGADPKPANKDGLNALYATVDMKWRANSWYPQPTVEQEKTDYLDLMKTMIEKGADVNARMGRKLWFRKFRYGDDWVDPKGATAFFRAAQSNDLVGMKFLIAHGADPSIATNAGVTPLMVASGIGFEYQGTNVAPEARMACVKYLVEDLKQPIGLKDEKGYTALHGAAYMGDNELVKYMLSKGADIHARSNARLIGTQGYEDVGEGQGDSIADMANGPREKSLLHPETLAMLEALGSVNSHDCRSAGCVNNTRPDKPKPGAKDAKDATNKDATAKDKQ